MLSLLLAATLCLGPAPQPLSPVVSIEVAGASIDQQRPKRRKRPRTPIRTPRTIQEFRPEKMPDSVRLGIPNYQDWVVDGTMSSQPVNLAPPAQSNEGTEVIDTYTKLYEQAHDPDSVRATYSRDSLARHLIYPRVLRDNGVRGEVVLHVRVDTNGRATYSIAVLSDNKALEPLARRTVQETPFTPARRRGAAVESWLEVPITFD